ncbi:hypothetical protein MKX07_000329 [Trichoderma sp. CBMAI-0711]|nr:hypothetical protein MKX07_000329 [Trichoderma sp. CBMAI-0711]
MCHGITTGATVRNLKEALGGGEDRIRGGPSLRTWHTCLNPRPPTWKPAVQVQVQVQVRVQVKVDVASPNNLRWPCSRHGDAVTPAMHRYLFTVYLLYVTQTLFLTLPGPRRLPFTIASSPAMDAP